MTKATARVSIDELSRNAAGVVERVSRNGERLVVERNGQALALLAPLPSTRRPRRRARTAADYEAARSAAGSWAGEDADALVGQVRSSREG
jgi:antitoxin (DNA-binding transcriptional repressor) of toxin-antitoxin stability system